MAFMNLSSLSSELLNKLKSNSTAISSNRRTLWLNQACDDIANEFDFGHLYVTRSFSSVANTRDYYLDVAYNRIQNLHDTTNRRDLDQISEDQLREIDPDMSQTGVPYYYSLWGWSNIQVAVPAGGGVISVVSDSAADTTQKIRINGKDADGIAITELLTMNGTSTVTGTKTFAAVDSVVKDTVADDIIHVTCNSVEIVTFAPNALITEYQPLYLWPTPSGVNTYVVRGYRKPRLMVYDQDFPDFPAAYHELILWMAVVKGHRDLFRVPLANDILQSEVLPRLQQIKREQGTTRAKRSPVIRSNTLGYDTPTRSWYNEPIG